MPCKAYDSCINVLEELCKTAPFFFLFLSVGRLMFFFFLMLISCRQGLQLKSTNVPFI